MHSRMRSRPLCRPLVLLPAALALAAPATASAHGGPIQRTTLPIPDWLFGWGAVAVLVISFAALALLWPRPQLERPSWRPLPLGIGQALGSRAVEVLCGLIGVALLAIVVVAGYIGPDSAADNLLPTFVMITFWVGFVVASILFGDVFRAFNPWRAVGRAVGAVVGRRGPARRPYPQALGRWPAAAGLLMFTWIELVGQWADRPVTLANAVVGYTVVTLAAQSVYGVDTWTRRGEAFSVYYNLLSRLSAFETRDRVVGVRPPLSGLPRLDQAPGTVAFVMVMIGTVTFDGLSQGALWNNVGPALQDAFTWLGAGLDAAPRLADTVGLLAAVGLIAGFYALGIEGAKSVGGGFTAAQLRAIFVHSLVPIACVYALAHYFTYLLYEGQAIQYLASDPFGQGWDLFGTASAAIDFSLLSQNTTWYLQFGLVIVGHVAALMLAHDRALVTYGQATQAVRSQYWMLAIMVGFTLLALWLLRQAGS
jgi:hypothetical protein